jgi:hypothetical protein
MRFLAEFVMRGRMQAVLVTAVAAMLTLVIPLLAYLSGAAVGLVTLRINPKQGLAVIAGAVLTVAVLSSLVFGNTQFGIGFAVVFMMLWLPVWILAASLRRSVNLAKSLKLAGLFGAMLVIGFYLATDNPATWWQVGMEKVLSPALEGAAKERIDEMNAAVAETAQMMTGYMGGLMGLNLMICLFIARWWQAMLYNPGGFRQEFHRLRLGKGFALGILVIVLMLLISSGKPMVVDLLVVTVMLFMVQGLAVSHSLVANAGAGWGWLVMLYVLLVLAQPPTALTLAMAGFVDNWFDFRAFFGNKPKQ